MIFNFDAYTRKARLMPVFILLIPLGLVVFAWFPKTLFWQSLPTAFSIPIIFTVLFSELGRDMGKKKEWMLFKKWEGMPTDKTISFLGSLLDKNTIIRYRSKIEKLLPDLKLPTINEEIKNPQKCIQIYKSCTNFLREKTRDSRAFPILFAENTSYGFRRNLWAMKPIGIFLSTLATIFILIKIIIIWNKVYLIVVPCTCLIINMGLLMLWIFWITSDWVKITAFAYAKQLFASCDNF